MTEPSMPHRHTTPTPFSGAEEAWFWTMAALLARQDGASATWRPDPEPRPCDPEDVLNCLNALFLHHAVQASHAHVLKLWGRRQTAPLPDEPGQAHHALLWQQAMAPFEWALRGRGIVR